MNLLSNLEEAQVSLFNKGENISVANTYLHSHLQQARNLHHIQLLEKKKRIIDNLDKCNSLFI